MESEERARKKIDDLLTAAGWQVQDYRDLNLGAGWLIVHICIRSSFSEYWSVTTGRQ